MPEMQECDRRASLQAGAGLRCRDDHGCLFSVQRDHTYAGSFKRKNEVVPHDIGKLNRKNWRIWGLFAEVLWIA